MVERVDDSTEDIESKHFILVPSFILIIEDVVHLQPEVEIFGNAEFCTGIQVKCCSTLEIGKGAIPDMLFVLRSVPGPEVCFYPQVLQHLPAQRCIESIAASW